MDIIKICLGTVAWPSLDPAFLVFRFVYGSYTRVLSCTCKQQLRVLTQSLAYVLKTLNLEYQSGKIFEADTVDALSDLNLLLNDVTTLTEKCASEHFLKTLFTKELRQHQIKGLHRRIDVVVAAFQISDLIDTQSFQEQHDIARAQDQENLDERLIHIEENHSEMRQILQKVIGTSSTATSTNDQQTVALMASLDRRSKTANGEIERGFFSHCAQYLTTLIEKPPELENWTITSFDVEFGPEIGSGSFGQVFKGRCGTIPVAVRVLKLSNRVSPSPDAVRSEVTIWSKLEHTNVLQFLGANILDGRPFLVMPYLKHGNSKDYIRQNPRCDRLKVLYDTSLGLLYLHDQNIVHGNLKAANILINDSGTAVLCDFGLSRIKAETTSHAYIQNANNGSESRNWMAPELLLGNPQRKPSDIYALGLTVFEIYTGETPLSNVLCGDGEFIELVVRNHVRPERPSREEAPTLSGEIWRLAEKCWALVMTERPTIEQVCDAMVHFSDPNTAPPSPTTPLRRPSIQIRTPLLARIPGFIRTHARTSSAHRPLTGGERLQLDGHSDWVYCIAFSSNGKRLVSGSRDKTVRIWDVANWNQLHLLVGHTDFVCTVAFSPDGQLAGSGSWDKSIRIWDVQTGRQLYTLTGHTGDVKSVAFSPNGKWVVSGSRDGSVRIWLSVSGVPLSEFRGHSNAVSCVTFSPDGQRVASGSVDHTIRIRDSSTGTEIKKLKGHSDDACSLSYSPDGSQIVSGSNDNSIRIWDASTGKELRKIKGHTEHVKSVAFSPDGERIASCSYDNSIRVWDAATGNQIHKMDGHTSYVLSVAFCPDGKQVASASADNSICIWSLDPREPPNSPRLSH